MGTTKRTSPTVQILLIALTLSGLRLSGVHFVASTSVPWGGIALAQTSGICDRTQAVRDAILPKLSAVSDCADVADTHLGGITGDLTLSEKNIPALRAGDFQGLTGLKQLYLNNNNLSDLPGRRLRRSRKPRPPVAELQSGASPGRSALVLRSHPAPLPASTVDSRPPPGDTP